MLCRLLPKPSHFRPISPLLHSKPQHHIHSPIYSSLLPRLFSTGNDDDNNNNNNNNNNDSFWNSSSKNYGKSDSFLRRDSAAGLFSGEDKQIEGVKSGGGDGNWLSSQRLRGKESSSFFFVPESSSGSSNSQVDDEFEEGEGEEEEEEKKELPPEEKKMLLEEQKQLMSVLEGPNRTFGDLIAASGITDDMLDSLIALRDFEGIEGLPPLSEIEDMRYEKNTKKSTRGEIERQKQEEIAKGRVRKVDEKGRAYATGRRKCSVARVWIQPGDGQFVVNDKQFDVYFPMLDHRATLLRPFSETKTLGLWDINCTVKGGGVSGQVGAIRLGISRALQNWEPDLRPPLRKAGFLTRDPRVVERKKPGKAKARKSFQWVKR